MSGRRDRCAAEQGLLDLLGEQALAAGFGERPVLDPVAGGRDGNDVALPSPAGRAPALSRPAHLAAPAPAPAASRACRCVFCTACKRCWSPDARPSPIGAERALCSPRRSAIANPSGLAGIDLGRKDQPPGTAARRSCSASRRAATRPPRPSSGAMPPAAGASCPTSCARSGSSTAPLAASCPRSRRARMSNASTPSSARRWRQAGVAMARSRWRRGHRRPGTVGGLIVGLTTAKAIALARGIPLLPSTIWKRTR